MIKTLYVRVVLTFLAVILIALATSFLIGLILFHKELNYLGQHDMVEKGERIIRILDQTQPKDLDAYMESMTAIASFPIQIYTISGEMNVYGFSKPKQAIAISDNSINKVLSGEAYRSAVKNEGLFVGLPFQFDGKRYALFLQSSDKNENAIIRLIVTILILILLTGSLCILVAARFLVKPLKVLTLATKRLAKGDFDLELRMKRKDELGTLAQSFNEMAHELKQLEQMRQDFVSNVSHEIQSPLTSITGFAKALMIHDMVTAGDRDRYLGIIISESERLSRLSDNLLKLASLESEHHPFEYCTFKLDEQIRQVFVSTEPHWISKNMRMELKSLMSAPITADSDLLNQVWMNLISNSIKFTPNGGEILVEISRNRDEYKVTITDTGIGISADERIRIFERFYKAGLAHNRSSAGNGLGLAIVNKIIALHHGSIDVKSELGKGTTVAVILPFAPQASLN